MRIILLGPPGAGKGTQGEQLCKTLQITKISTGDMLRSEIAANTPIGQKMRSLIAAGQLVPDEEMIALLKTRIEKSDCRQGFLLDGFPRTLAQAEALDKAGIIIDYIISIAVPDAEIITRLSGRRVHLASGRTYHIQYHPPRVPGKDDETGEPLIQREDDKEEVIRKRLDVYHQATAPLIQWYKEKSLQGYTNRFIEVIGMGKESTIQAEIIRELGLT